MIFNLYFNLSMGAINYLFMAISNILDKNGGFDKWNEEVNNKAKKDSAAFLKNKSNLTKGLIRCAIHILNILPIVNILMLFCNLLEIVITIQGNKMIKK